MSSTLELDSTFRNRQLWPKPGEFEVLISQTGRNTQQNMLDPVATAMPVVSWTSNLFDVNNLGATNIQCTVSNTLLGQASGPVQRSCAVLELTVTFPSILQEQYNYYVHSIIHKYKRRVEEPSVPTGKPTGIPCRYLYARILEYTYMGSGRAQIVIDNNADFDVGDVVVIGDPTDFSDTDNSFIFVPTGSGNSGAYLQNVLYNQTLNDSRSVRSYDGRTGLLRIDGNTTGWSQTHNYSLRSSSPNYTFFAGVASNVNQIVVTGTHGEPKVPSPVFSGINFQNWFIRIPAVLYNNSIVAPQTESRRIVSFDPVTNTATVNPPLTSSPAGMDVELMQLGYDNANPFNWRGNMTSEMPVYRIRLKRLTLPNLIMSVGGGGKPSYSNYFYVELSNVTLNDNKLYNIFSNNPYSSKAMFRATVKDLHDLDRLKFIALEGDMEQTVRFRLDSNVKMRVVIPNTGETFETVEKDRYSPNPPNTDVQICALFEFHPI